MLASSTRRRRIAAALTSAAFLVATLFALLGPAETAFAASGYSSGTPGYDISYPNCGTSIPTTASNGSPYTFGIVGVNDGKPFTTNPCFAQEYALANGTSSPPSLYMNLSYPAGSTIQNAFKGPKTCARSDKSCAAYNYGYSAAEYAYNTATNKAAAKMWWLDIETANLWMKNTTANAQVIQGAIDFFSGQYNSGVSVPVGVYSINSMWGTITGNYNLNGLPIWIAGANSLPPPTAYCSSSSSYAFGNGTPTVVQYWNSALGYDEDYAC